MIFTTKIPATKIPISTIETETGIEIGIEMDR